MNGQPHIHQLSIRDHGWFWGITYGDQTIMPEKWWSTKWGLISEQKALAAECRKVIRQHDKASQRALVSTDVATAVISELQPTQPDAWGSTR